MNPFTKTGKTPRLGVKSFSVEDVKLKKNLNQKQIKQLKKIVKNYTLYLIKI